MIFHEARWLKKICKKFKIFHPVGVEDHFIKTLIIQLTIICTSSTLKFDFWL